ncbi:MAG: hypothetical protein QXY05_01270 [Candidatus Anstonellales archaeon]
MKRALALLLLFFLSNAAFYIQQINIDFYVKDDGTVTAKERIKVLVEGETDVARYNAALNKDDLATWAELIGSGDIRVHVNRDVVNVQNLAVRPQPLSHSLASDTWRGEIIITYDASGYTSEDGEVVKGTGMFNAVDISPRITQYELRDNALSLRTTTGGDYILESGQKLTFYLPDNAVVMDLNPMPRSLAISLPARLESVSWSDSILVGHTFVFKVEKGMDDEIYTFFKDAERRLVYIGKTTEGMALIVMFGAILLTYVYLQYSKSARKRA